MTLEQAAGEAQRRHRQPAVKPACGPSTHANVMHHSDTSEGLWSSDF